MQLWRDRQRLLEGSVATRRCRFASRPQRTGAQAKRQSRGERTATQGAEKSSAP